MRLEIVSDVPEVLRVNQAFARELKAATSHFEFLFLQLSNLNSGHPANFEARAALTEAFEKFHHATNIFYYEK